MAKIGLTSVNKPTFENETLIITFDTSRNIIRHSCSLKIGIEIETYLLNNYKVICTNSW